jgi:hypothetical protein
MINPHFCYILGFLFSMAVYQLNWSDAYPRLEWSLVVFLTITLIAHLLSGLAWKRKLMDQSVRPAREGKPLASPVVVTSLLLLLWFVNFLHEGIVPLINVIFKIPFDYKIFGTPVLHVFVVTFTSFYCLYLLDNYLRSKNQRTLQLYALNFLPAILVFSRSMMLFILATSFFLYLLHLRSIQYRWLFLLFPLSLLLLYLFGVLGTIRVSFEAQTTYDERIFLDVGSASESFRNSKKPKEFFWPYIYISSPLANLQTNIKTYPVRPITTALVLEYMNNEWLVESLSKRFNHWAGIQRESERTIKEQFNVSTVYSRSYSYLGWWGMIATAAMLLVVPVLYLKLIPDPHYQRMGIALMCTTYLFLCYDNTIRLMALGFQLIYPILFSLAEAKWATLKHAS